MNILVIFRYSKRLPANSGTFSALQSQEEMLKSGNLSRKRSKDVQNCIKVENFSIF